MIPHWILGCRFFSGPLWWFAEAFLNLSWQQLFTSLLASHTVFSRSDLPPLLRWGQEERSAWNSQECVIMLVQYSAPLLQAKLMFTSSLLLAFQTSLHFMHASHWHMPFPLSARGFSLGYLSKYFYTAFLVLRTLLWICCLVIWTSLIKLIRKARRTLELFACFAMLWT